MSSKDLKKLIQTLKTPQLVQKYLRSLEYNKKDTLYSAETTARKKTAHCFEAAILAAAILENHGYPPTVMSFESIDDLDHVIFVFRKNGKWGSVGRSRDEGLHGRAPVFRSLRDLAWSYYEPYIDKTGRITGFQIANLDESNSQWRNSKKSVWKAERFLIDLPHQKLVSSTKKFRQIKERYLRNGPLKSGRHWW